MSEKYALKTYRMNTNDEGSTQVYGHSLVKPGIHGTVHNIQHAFAPQARLVPLLTQASPTLVVIVLNRKHPTNINVPAPMQKINQPYRESPQSSPAGEDNRKTSSLVE